LSGESLSWFPLAEELGLNEGLAAELALLLEVACVNNQGRRVSFFSMKEKLGFCGVWGILVYFRLISAFGVTGLKKVAFSSIKADLFRLTCEQFDIYKFSESSFTKEM